MFGVKMSLEASDVQTDEDCEELVSPWRFGSLHETSLYVHVIQVIPFTYLFNPPIIFGVNLTPFNV